MREIRINSERELRAAFDNFNPDRVLAGNAVIIATPIHLSTDFEIDVPVNFKMEGNALVDTNGNTLQLQKSCQEWPEGMSVTFERHQSQ